MKRYVGFVTALVVVAFLATGTYLAFARDGQELRNKSTANTITPQSSKKSVRLYAMGDMLAHDSVVNQARKGGAYDFTSYFSAIRSKYSDADAVFCNAESLVSGDIDGVSGYPAFNAPGAFAYGLRDQTKGAGCDLISMGNNHSYDKGQEVMNHSIDVWRALKPKAVTGANKSVEEQNTIPIFTIHTVRVALVSFNDYSNNPPSSGYALNTYHDTALVERLMKTATDRADAVIVSVHWGQENTIRSNQDQQSAAALFARLGADVVIGTGPHVWQEVAYIPKGSSGNDKTLVWYSLGNMLNSQLTPDQLTSGIAGFTIQKNEQGIAIQNITVDPTFMSYNWPAEARARDDLNARANLQLKPLSSSDIEIKRMFGQNYSAEERLQFLKNTVRNNVPVRFR